MVPERRADPVPPVVPGEVVLQMPSAEPLPDPCPRLHEMGVQVDVVVGEVADHEATEERIELRRAEKDAEEKVEPDEQGYGHQGRCEQAIPLLHVVMKLMYRVPQFPQPLPARLPVEDPAVQDVLRQRPGKNQADYFK